MNGNIICRNKGKKLNKKLYLRSIVKFNIKRGEFLRKDYEREGVNNL